VKIFALQFLLHLTNIIIALLLINSITYLYAGITGCQILLSGREFYDPALDLFNWPIVIHDWAIAIFCGGFSWYCVYLSKKIRSQIKKRKAL
jgi:hypothetical protein